MKLSAYLQKHDIKQAEFARKTGLSVATVSRLVNDKQRPDWNTMLVIKAETKEAVTPDDYDVPEDSAAASMPAVEQTTSGTDNNP